jgi:hypothetical protein
MYLVAMPVRTPQPAHFHAPLHPSDLIALEITAWAFSLQDQPSRMMRVYPQPTADGMAALARRNPGPMPTGHRVYRTSSW